jgi:hypothetical protein
MEQASKPARIAYCVKAKRLNARSQRRMLIERSRRMKIAIWVIAICEVVRILQNMAQLMMVHHDTGARDNAYAEFVKSLKDTDEEFVENLLREFERERSRR